MHSLLFYFEVGLIFDTVFVLGVQELDSAIHRHLLILFWVHFPQIEDYTVSAVGCPLLFNSFFPDYPFDAY